MILIIGGAYQGKLEYAKVHYKLQGSEILDCSQYDSVSAPMLTHRCIYHYEAYVEQCVLQGATPCTQFAPDQIVITEDVSCGVVPIDAHLRAWREACGRASSALAVNAEHVIRIFCGLPLIIK